MKRVIKLIVLVLSLSLTLTSCLNDWLSVEPKTQITGDVFFSEEEGFKDALTGLYIKLKSPTLYGERLTMTTMEHLVSSWQGTAATQVAFNRWQYGNINVEAQFKGIYAGLYNVIAEANAILERIDEAKELFETEGLYELIKAEAIAIRAFCHFDLLRLFGPVPTEEEITSDPILAYVKEVTRDPLFHVSFSNYKGQLLNDLATAEAMLLAVDPVVNESYHSLNYERLAGDYDQFFWHRHLRLNYFAVKGIRAMAHLWAGEKDEAFEAVTEILSATNPDGGDKFTLGKGSDMQQKNYNLTIEHIFALHQSTLGDTYDRLFANGTLFRGTNATVVRNNLYGNTGTDIRELYLWEVVTQQLANVTNIYKKYSSSGNVTFATAVPILRTVELYLIAVETAPTTAQAQPYWDSYRVARGLAAKPIPSSEEALKDELAKEYRKEFFAEGKAFYTFKRYNMANNKILWAPTVGVAPVNYVVPLPDTELIHTPS